MQGRRTEKDDEAGPSREQLLSHSSASKGYVAMHQDEYTTKSKVLRADGAAIGAFASALMLPDAVHEVRIPATRKGGPAKLYGIAAGYFDDVAALARAVSPLCGLDAEGVTITLNPVDPSLRARGHNKLLWPIKNTAGDTDITGRRHLLIDVDSKRPAGISATEEELAAALAVRDAARAYLGEVWGWPDPVMVTMSGNGGALVYKIDLANDDAATALIKGVLGALAALFCSTAVEIDTACSNAGRLTKLAGTVAGKGEDFCGNDRSPARRWRLVSASYPAGAQVVTPEQLAAVAALAPQPAPAGHNGHSRTWTLEDVLRLNNLHGTIRRQSYGTVYRLDRCLTSDAHGDGACLIEFGSGAIDYRCLHNSCAGKDWSYLRQHGLVQLPPAGPKNGASGNGHTPEQERAKRGPAAGGHDQQRRRHIISMAEFLAEPHEKRVDLVEGLIPLAQAGLIVGEGALGKTLLMMELARARARGLDFLGRKTVPGKTLLCLFDDPRSLTKQRCHELFDAKDDVSLIAARYEQDMYPEVAEYVAQHEPEVVVVDTLAMITPPTPGAENDPPTMKKVMEPYIKLANNEKTTIVFLHHDNAEGGVRGTTAIRNNVQWTLSMKALDPDEQGKSRVQCAMRWKYEPIAPFVLTMTALAAFVPGGAPQPTQPAGKTNRQRVLDALQQAPKQVLSIEDLGAKTDLSRRQLDPTLRELVGDKLVVPIGKGESAGKRGAKPVLYGLAARPQDAESTQAELFTYPGGEGSGGYVNNNLQQNPVDCCTNAHNEGPVDGGSPWEAEV